MRTATLKDAARSEKFYFHVPDVDTASDDIGTTVLTDINTIFNGTVK